MMRRFLSAWFALAVAMGVGACGGSTGGEADTTVHDNWVFPESNWGYAQVAFELTDYRITKGQSFDGVSTGQPDQVWGIDVKAGRHGSSPPAEWFRSNASVATCTMDCTTDWPSNLNFAITGTFTIDGTGYPITIGQGSTPLGANNWWIGGPGWTIHSGVYPNVVTPDGQYVFRPQEDDSDSFWICRSYDACPP